MIFIIKFTSILWSKAYIMPPHLYGVDLQSFEKKNILFTNPQNCIDLQGNSQKVCHIGGLLFFI